MCINNSCLYGIIPHIILFIVLSITIYLFTILFDERNPKPGQIINKPKGPDVYNGVVIDYKGAVRNF